MTDQSTGVGAWDPNEAPVVLDSALLGRLAELDLDSPSLGLAPPEVTSLAQLMRKPKAEWRLVVGGQSSASLLRLIRFFTLAEDRLPGWEAAENSPVIPMAAELRRRGDYPKDLTTWIKANTSNRFLPWGSLLDRL